MGIRRGVRIEEEDLIEKRFLSILIPVGEIGPAVTARERQGKDLAVVGEAHGSFSAGHSEAQGAVPVPLHTPVLDGVSALIAELSGQRVERVDQATVRVHTHIVEHESRQNRAAFGTIATVRREQIREWGEAHFREGATPAAIEALEASLGHRLPSELRDLLSETNGIEGEYGLGLLWDTERMASDNVQFRTSKEFADLYMPFEGLAFIADGGNGDQFFMSLSGNNEVYVWDHESDSRTWVAPTVLRYLETWMRGELTL